MLTIVRELLRELGSHQAAQNVTIDSSFDRDLGLGSLERVELLVRAEKRFNCRLPDEIAQRAQTPAEWIEALSNGGQVQTKPARFPIEPSSDAPAPPAECKTFVDVLRTQVNTEPDRIQIHLLEGDSGETITYAQLLERSQQVAAGLLEAGLKAQPNGSHHAADLRGLLLLILGDHAGRRHRGTDLPAGASRQN